MRGAATLVFLAASQLTPSAYAASPSVLAIDNPAASSQEQLRSREQQQNRP